MIQRNLSSCAGAAMVVMAAVLPAMAHADTTDDWKFAATIYGWLPSVNIDTSIPGGGSSVNVTTSDILNALNFTFMGAFDAQKGPWGIGTDIIYLDLSTSKKQTRDITIGDIGLPAGITAKVSYGLTGWVWTTGVSYSVIDKPDYKLGLLAGARMLNLNQDLKWSLSGDLGDPPIIDRSGHASPSGTNWDAIVGIKGRAMFGADRKWFIPYYADVGTGDSNLTWQGIIGAGYSFDWGDVLAVYRYLDYQMPSKDIIQNVDLKGAAIGVTFRF